MLCKLFLAFASIGLVRGRAHEPASPWTGQLGAFKKDCIKNNVDLAGVEAALQKSVDCINTEVGDDGQRLITMAQIFMDEETVVAAARHLCSKKDKLINVCAFDFIDYTAPCLDPEYRVRVNDSKLAMQDLANYICENDVQLIRTMFSEDENKCWRTNNVESQLRQCVGRISSLDVDSLSRTEQCIEFHKLKDCALRSLRNCPTYANFFERFFTDIVVGSPCEKRPAALDSTIIGPVSPQDRAIAAMSAQLKKECIKHNAGDVTGVEAASTRATECLAAEIDDETRMLISRAKLLQDEESVVGAARKLCTKKEKLGVCVFNLMDFMVPCMDPELRGRVNDSKAALQDFTNYICENDAQVISNLFGKEELTCLESTDINKKLLQCTAEVRTLDLDSMSPLELCTEFYKLKYCSIGALGRCSTRTYADLMERFFTAIAVGSRCENMSTFTITNVIDEV